MQNENNKNNENDPLKRFISNPFDDSDNLMQGDNFILNLDRVSADSTVFYITRKVAKTILNQGYYSVGNFFNDLSDSDFSNLIELIRSVQSVDFKNFTITHEEQYNMTIQYGLLCGVLSTGEGVMTALNAESIENSMKIFSVLCFVEMHRRKGNVKTFRENYSLWDIDKPIAESNKGEGNV